MANDVPELVFELLHGEIVRSLKNVDGGNGVEQKLSRMGFRVGQSWIERLAKDRVRFKDELEVMKFICKEFWTSLFNKQIDNLRTNHQGVYVLQDSKFHFLPQMSSSTQYADEALTFLAYPSGMVRGALAALGINSTVGYEITSMPGCKFTITVQMS
ncbi:trafficking protein particle complex subunit 6b-like [Oscarella lobularis]|uniref:trafficking protein particle complex subunit 6b-like n=1 Tax=Oscarella lobularis TaxID=121494 RepID=UPI0033135E2B